MKSTSLEGGPWAVDGQAPTVATIPVASIELDPDNVRSTYDPENIERLRKSLETALKTNEQYIHPPSVYPVGKGRYRVKHGNCRVMAARGVVDLIHVRLVNPPESRGAKIMEQLSENLLQGGLNAMDTAVALRRLRDGEQLSVSGVVDALAQRGIGRGKFWVKMHLGLVDLHPSVQAAVRAGQIPPRTAWLLRTLPEPDQIALAREIADRGLTQRQVEQRLGLNTPRESTADQDAPQGDFAHAPSEYNLARLSEDLKGAATTVDEAGVPVSFRRPTDSDHRDGPVRQRWEVVAASVPEDMELAALDSQQWAAQATPQQRQLAQEALFFGRHSAVEAISLVERVSRELDAAPAHLVAAVNYLREVADNPAALKANSGLAELLRIRLERLGATLKSI